MTARNIPGNTRVLIICKHVCVSNHRKLLSLKWFCLPHRFSSQCIQSFLDSECLKFLEGIKREFFFENIGHFFVCLHETGLFLSPSNEKRFLVFTDGAHSNSKRSSKEALADCLASLSDMAHTGIDTSLSQLEIPGKSHTTEIFISRKRFKSGTKKKRSFPTIVSRILIITSLKGYFFWDIYKYISDRRKERESFKLFQL